MRRLAPVTILTIAALAFAACGGSDTAQPPPAEPPPAEPPPAEPPPAEPAPEPPAEPIGALAPGLPDDIAGYTEWVKLNSAPIPVVEGGDPHSGVKDVFASQEADRASGSVQYPNGTIVVKEAVAPDADFVRLVAIMRKVEGSDPDHNDWQFVEYTRSSGDEPFAEAASGQICWSCHMGAADTDYVWVHTTGAAP